MKQISPNLMKAIRLIVGEGEYRACSYMQRTLGIGWNEAAKHVETMERAGILSEANNVGKRRLMCNDIDKAIEMVLADGSEA